MEEEGEEVGGEEDDEDHPTLVSLFSTSSNEEDALEGDVSHYPSFHLHFLLNGEEEVSGALEGDALGAPYLQSLDFHFPYQGLP